MANCWPISLMAAETPVATVQKASLGTDVILVKGTLTGKVLTANGQPVDGAAVSVLKDGKEVGRAITTADGSYSVGDLKTGLHTIRTANGQYPVRLWTKEAAPASAKSQMTISQTAIRGQGLAGGALGGGGGAGGAAGGLGGAAGGLGGLGGAAGGLGALGGASLGTLGVGALAVGATGFAAVQVQQNQKLQDQLKALHSP